MVRTWKTFTKYRYKEERITGKITIVPSSGTCEEILEAVAGAVNVDLDGLDINADVVDVADALLTFLDYNDAHFDEVYNLDNGGDGVVDSGEDEDCDDDNDEDEGMMWLWYSNS